jgi:hypothetical protein
LADAVEGVLAWRQGWDGALMWEDAVPTFGATNETSKIKMEINYATALHMAADQQQQHYNQPQTRGRIGLGIKDEV